MLLTGRSLLPATRAWDRVLEWTWWSNLPHGPERDRRTGTDESFAVDSAGGRVRPVDRLVLDRGGGSGASGRQHQPSAEHMRKLRSAAGAARPRSRRELVGAARQVPALSQSDRHRADGDRVGERRDLGAVHPALPRRHDRGLAGVPDLRVGAGRPELDRHPGATAAARDHLHRDGARRHRADRSPRSCSTSPNASGWPRSAQASRS